MRQPRSDVARNRRLLVEAAIESFQEFGWDVPLDRVARRAGVGNATLYRHFPTRDDLYEGAFAEIHERLGAVLCLAGFTVASALCGRAGSSRWSPSASCRPSRAASSRSPAW